jgi:hypothetical protein
MAIIAKEKYSQEKIDKLHDYLKMYRDMGEPIDYEIIIDGFKAVRRTKNTDMFPMFEGFVNGSTKAIEIILYQGSSNHNDKHIFTLDETPKETGLSGVDVENMVNDRISKAKQEWDFEQLKKDNKEWEEYAADLEEKNESLEKELKEIKGSQSPLHGMLGEFGSSFLSGLVKNNPALANKIPGLSGITEAPAKENSAGKPVGEDISFTSAEPAPNNETMDAQTFVKNLRQHFPDNRFVKLMEVIDFFVEDQSKLDTVLTQLKAG